MLLLCAILFLMDATANGEIWTTPKPIVQLPLLTRYTESSAVIPFLEYTSAGSPNIMEIDNSDISIRVDFEKPIGIPIEVEMCENGRSKCVHWMNKTSPGVVAQLILRNVDSDFGFRPLQYSPSDQTRTEIIIQGPAHTITFHNYRDILYGGPIDKFYPSNKNIQVNAPYITSMPSGDHISESSVRPVAERVWLTSTGRGLQVSETTPLFVTQNDTFLVFHSQNEEPYPVGQATVLTKILMCQTNDVKQAWLCINSNFKKPKPAKEIIRKPVASTWRAFKTDISQTKILEFARNLKSQLNIGTIEIDAGWESCFGNYSFDNNKFPDPQKMITELHKMGLKVTLYAHPFMNVDCDAYGEAKDVLLKYDNGEIAKIKWAHGEAGIVNFFNETIAQLYSAAVKTFMSNSQLDGYTFGYGEAPTLTGKIGKAVKTTPNAFTNNYVTAANLIGGSIIDVSVGDGTSNADVLLRIQPKKSSWALENNGLKSIIPEILQLSALGYTPMLSNVIGGSVDMPKSEMSKELFIRWVQLSTFLPVMEFSFEKWNFGAEVLKLTKKFVDLHNEYSSYMMDVLYDDSNLPLINPVWWIDPTNPVALKCDDEFLVGDQILVAPIVEKGALSRDIYFPTGMWRDVGGGFYYQGPKLVKNFHAPLDYLPWFIRMPFNEVL